MTLTALNSIFANLRTPARLCASACFLAGVALSGMARPAHAQKHAAVSPRALVPKVTMAAAPATLTIDTTSIVQPVNPMMYGLMTEEINHSYDGGLYAELISNPTMRGSWMGLENWNVVGHGSARVSMGVDDATGPSAALHTSLKVTVDDASTGSEAGVTNSGYWGIALRPHTTYTGSLYAVADAALATAPLTARLVADDSGAVLASTTIALHSGPWQKYDFTLTTNAAPASTKNHLELLVAQSGTLHLQLVSLFPPTFHNRPEGNRTDLINMMAAMHPQFIRLPGGNYLEGDRLEDWYNWKQTIGPRVDRPGHQAPWTYWSTDGFGLLEFLNWTTDLNNEPILAVYAGYALKGDHIKPGKDLEPFVQSALDEVEYVTGDTTTKWGAQRAKDGHPAPFPLHYIEVGNEDFFDKSGSYDARFAQFALALRKRFPQYKLIATAPVKEDPAAVPDLIDDHFYKSPADMFALVHHYDAMPRTGPKIFVGEWATRSGSPTPNFGDALGDAAWMTAMERNSDLIQINAYAPLLVNINPGGMQWPTDLIGFDGLTSYGSPSYYAQVLFANHLGDGVPKVTASGMPAPGGAERFFYSATVSSSTHTLHLKLVNANSTAQPLALEIAGAKSGSAKINTLHAASFQATNSMTEPKKIVPVVSTLTLTGGKLQHTVPAYTIQVLDVPIK